MSVNVPPVSMPMTSPTCQSARMAFGKRSTAGSPRPCSSAWAAQWRCSRMAVAAAWASPTWTASAMRRCCAATRSASAASRVVKPQSVPITSRMSRLTAARTWLSLERASRSWKLRSASITSGTETTGRATRLSIRSTSSSSAATSAGFACSAIQAAACGSISSRNSYRSRRNGSALPSRRSASCTVALRMSQSSAGHTSVRLPCWMLTIPSIASACTVSRATVRLTPYWVTISSEEGNASPTPIRPETISAARSVESCWLRRRGSRRPSMRPRRSPDTNTPRRQSERREMTFEQRPRHVGQRVGGRAEMLAFEHATLREDVLRAGVVVVDRILHREDEHRQQLTQPFVRERALPARLGFVDLDEEIDEVDPGDDPRGAAAHAVEQVHPAVATPDRELGAETVGPAAQLRRPGLELHQPRVLGARSDPLHDLGAEPDAEMGRCVLDHHWHADRSCDPDEVVDEGRFAERPDHRGGDDHAGRAGGLGVAGELDRGADAGSADADEDGHGGSRFLDDEVGERSALVGGQLQHLAGEAEGDDAVGAALEREANDPPLRLEVDRVVVRERRADRRVHASPCVERRRHP